MTFKKHLAWLISLLLIISIAFGGCDALVSSDSELNESIEVTEGKGTQSSTTDGNDDANSTENGTQSSTTDGNDDANSTENGTQTSTQTGEQKSAEKLLGVARFSGKPYATINNNTPVFSDEEITTVSYEFYSELDSLGRCGYAEACIGRDLMPTEEREGSLSSVTPSGWINKKYDTELVDGGYIYNRAHLIGWQLTAELANKKNLITGTRYMNVSGMLPFENLVADYIKETDNHVMYRVTPIYDGNDLVACGVQMEAYSVEDNGEGVSFNVYIYNVQPGITIEYATGNSYLSGELPETENSTENTTENASGEISGNGTYILNTSSKKIHLPTCRYAESINDENKEEYTGSKQALIDDGYTSCGTCKP